MDDDNSNLLVAQLLYLDSIGKKDITMYVNSPGGSVTAGRSPASFHVSSGGEHMSGLLAAQILAHNATHQLKHDSARQTSVFTAGQHDLVRMRNFLAHLACKQTCCTLLLQRQALPDSCCVACPDLPGWFVWHTTAQTE